ncbi:Na+/H+ antiporter NhaA [Microlunatus spumicola]|uniref:Na(+)/H(+) antiporter NhaA n=1 Tax=Microlunatus spumicola TaxID=81499 RepID=A0ABP6WKF6_9ACTN
MSADQAVPAAPDETAPAEDDTAQTPWLRRGQSSLRALLLSESGSAGVLVAAILVALLWANVAPASYTALWTTELSVRLGSNEIAMDLQEWVNKALMTLFFLVVGLEARRELDLGELRDRKRFLLPLVAGLVAMLVPVLLYLAVNAGEPSAAGWGAAMSTDTALSLGLLSVVGRVVPDRVRLFLLTVFVVDDLVALVVIAIFYSEPLDVTAIVVALVVFGLFLLALRLRVEGPAVYAVMGVVLWLALLESGVDPVVAGLAIGLAASAYTPTRERLEGATALFRTFREEPTPELARTASVGVIATLSPNARLQRFYVPGTTYVIVPLFGLANAGFTLDGDLLARAVTSPITLGIVLGYVVGKPAGVLLASWAVTRFSRGRIKPPVGWLAVAGSGTVAGVAFTVSLLIASLAFDGPELAEAKLGILATTVLSLAVTLVVFHASRFLAPDRRARALLGSSQTLLDLAEPFDDSRDHYRGRRDASVILYEYGDFECPHCGLAEPAARAELENDDDLLFVWRHLPLTDVHPHAQLAAEASEAAGRQDAFWPLHDLLLTHQGHLTRADLLGYAADLDLDVERFADDLDHHVHADRIASDIDSADRSGVSGTPTFFVNGRRHYGAYDAASLQQAVADAHERAGSLRH